jgi:hypothetical protein
VTLSQGLGQQKEKEVSHNEKGMERYQHRQREVMRVIAGRFFSLLRG